MRSAAEDIYIWDHKKVGEMLPPTYCLNSPKRETWQFGDSKKINIYPLMVVGSKDAGTHIKASP